MTKIKFGWKKLLEAKVSLLDGSWRYFLLK